MTVLIFKISDRIFQGFEVILDTDYFDSNEHICNQVKRCLITHCETYKLENLNREVKSMNFHIHDSEFGEILLKKKNTIIWICSC